MNSKLCEMLRQPSAAAAGQWGPEAAAEIDDLRKANAILHALVTNRDAEIERLRIRNEALLGLIEVAYCPVDGKARVRDCQQCGCSAGLLLKDEQSAPPEGDNDPNGNRDLAREIDG